jgi:hypothetical protein
MIRQVIFICALTGLLAGCSSTPQAIDLSQVKGKIVPRPGVAPKANEILFQAGQYLKAAKTFKFKAKITRDILLDDDIRVQFGGVSNVTVQRPNKLRAIFNGDERSRRTYFDGETLTLYSLSRKTYVQKKITGTIGNAIDFIFEKFGFAIPLADIVYPNPYAILIENVDKGYFVGQHKIDGTLCDHLVFQQDLIDWQIWIEAGEAPLIRKLLLTYKTEEGNPEYEAVLSNWKLNISLSDADFKFIPPAGVEKIEFLPIDRVYGPEEIIELETEEAK